MSNVQNSQANQTHSRSTKLFLILSFILFNLPFSIGQDSTNYEIIYDLPNGKQVVNKDGKVGMIDARSKKVVVPFEYDFSKNLGIIDGFVELLKGSNLIIVTKIQYDTITYTTLPKEVKKKLMWGLLDTSGKVITSTIWSSIAPFQDKKAVVSLETLNGLINDQGLIILPAIYYDIKRLDNGNYLTALQKRGYYDCEIRDRSMNTLWVTDSLDRRVYSKGMDNPNYLEFRRKDKEGIIDINGKVIIPAIFNYVLSIKANDKIALVRSETGCGYYNYEQNKWLTSAIYEGESEKASYLKNLFLKRGKVWDIFNKNGVQLGSFKADYILSAKEADFCVYGFENEEKIVTSLGVIDDKGKIIREPFLKAFRYGNNKTFQGKYSKDEEDWRDFEWATGNEVKNVLLPEESKRN